MGVSRPLPTFFADERDVFVEDEDNEDGGGDLVRYTIYSFTVTERPTVAM